MAIWVPSMETTRCPAKRTLPVAPLSADPVKKVKSSRSGLGPTRRIAVVIAAPEGTTVGVPRPAIMRENTWRRPCPVNNAPARSR